MNTSKLSIEVYSRYTLLQLYEQQGAILLAIIEAFTAKPKSNNPFDVLSEERQTISESAGTCTTGATYTRPIRETTGGVLSTFMSSY